MSSAAGADAKVDLKPVPPTHAEQLAQLKLPLLEWLEKCAFGMDKEDAEIFFQVCKQRYITLTPQLLLTAEDRSAYTATGVLHRRSWVADGLNKYFAHWDDEFGPNSAKHEAEQLKAGLRAPPPTDGPRCLSETVGFLYCAEVGLRNRVWSAIVNFYGEDAVELMRRPMPATVVPPPNTIAESAAQSTGNAVYIPSIDGKDVHLNAGGAGGKTRVFVDSINASGAFTIGAGSGAMVPVARAPAAAVAREKVTNTHAPGSEANVGPVDMKDDLDVNVHSGTKRNPTRVEYGPISTEGTVSLNINAPPAIAAPKCTCTAMQRMTCGHDIITEKTSAMAALLATWQTLTSADFKGHVGVWRSDRNEWCEATVRVATDGSRVVTAKYRDDYLLPDETLDLLRRSVFPRLRIFG